MVKVLFFIGHFCPNLPTVKVLVFVGIFVQVYQQSKVLVILATITFIDHFG